ncbi:MAG: HupE/UreJ family protein [Marinifilaceae bacterium]|jgi:hypothetical protein|nr:HupE/UreJ family protein [Marinifilaceae bacterium]
MDRKKIIAFLAVTILCFVTTNLFAHGVNKDTQTFLLGNEGVNFIPFLYIGAEHMITGYDHLLFLVAVVFFLTKPREVFTYVSFFTIGHSTTLLLGVLADISINSNLIDAIIALSIIYKAFDNLGGFKQIFGKQPNTKLAVLVFGLFHGFGLASKLQELSLAKNGLFTNLIGFNIGVEIGQFMALVLVIFIISKWRKHQSFLRFSTLTNTLLMIGGVVLMGYQLVGYLVNN